LQITARGLRRSTRLLPGLASAEGRVFWAIWPADKGWFALPPAPAHPRTNSIKTHSDHADRACAPIIAITTHRLFSKSKLRTLPENIAALDPAAHAHANEHVLPIQTALKSFDKRIVSPLPRRNRPQLARSKAACNAWDAKQ
jgi:hypothetical protein